MLIDSHQDIPCAPFYVCATDAFMSGWGLSKGLNNRVILPCSSLDEAFIVANYARSRSEMKRVTICENKPTLRHHANTYSLMTRETARAWFPAKG